MSIYTRTGDKGETSLFNGKRMSKADLRIEVCGTIDELNSAIGMVLSIKYKVLSIEKELTKIQNDLFNVGSNLTNSTSNHELSTIYSLQGRVKEFENIIDQMTEKLPPLKNFILPGGGKTGAMLHLSRTICRRAERKIVALNNKEKVDGNIIIYFNRLSDLLFTMARFSNFKEKKEEVVWSGHQPVK